MDRKANSIRKYKYFWLPLVALITLGLLYFSRAYGVNFDKRSLALGDSRASATTSYKLSFDPPGSEVLGSIQLTFCKESPLVGDTCSTPPGFDASAVTLSGQSGEVGFTVLASGTNANTIVLSRAPSVTTSTTMTYDLAGIINPSATGEFFARLQTFASSDASGPANEQGGLAMNINSAIQVSATVPPYLLFCLGVTITPYDCSTVSGDYVNFGNLNKTSTKAATTQMLIATNAKFGYVVNVFGTTMISGTNIIDGLSAPDVSRPGTSQFGLNLVANTTPSVGSNRQGNGTAAPAAGYNTPNFYKFASGDPVASVTTSDGYSLFTSSYIVNIPNGQPVGVYVSTLTYICLANF